MKMRRQGSSWAQPARCFRLVNWDLILLIKLRLRTRRSWPLRTLHVITELWILWVHHGGATLVRPFACTKCCRRKYWNLKISNKELSSLMSTCLPSTLSQSPPYLTILSYVVRARMMWLLSSPFKTPPAPSLNHRIAKARSKSWRNC